MLCLLTDVLSHGNVYKTKLVKIHSYAEGGIDDNLDYDPLDGVCFFLEYALR